MLGIVGDALGVRCDALGCIVVCGLVGDTGCGAVCAEAAGVRLAMLTVTADLTGIEFVVGEVLCRAGAAMSMKRRRDGAAFVFAPRGAGAGLFGEAAPWTERCIVAADCWGAVGATEICAEAFAGFGFVLMLT